MTGHGKVYEKFEENVYTPDDETIWDYLIQKSNESELEVLIIGEIIKRLKRLNKLERSQEELCKNCVSYISCGGQCAYHQTLTDPSSYCPEYEPSMTSIQSKAEGILRHITCNNPVTVSDTQTRNGNTYYRCNHCRRYGIVYRSPIQSLATKELEQYYKDKEREPIHYELESNQD